MSRSNGIVLKNCSTWNTHSRGLDPSNASKDSFGGLRVSMVQDGGVGGLWVLFSISSS